MRKLYFSAIVSFLTCPHLSAQGFSGYNVVHPDSHTVVMDSSSLPLVLMKLPYLWPPWDPIPDTPKVTVGMAVIDNGYNKVNHVTDPHNVYSGYIGIEKRGSISQAFWYEQKNYGLETRDSLGVDLDVVMLGMPSEHDWVLYGPYDDESLMRNVMMYQLGRDMGRWTPRTKYCEVQLYDWLWQADYRGLYVMMEKIKRDKYRVNIAKLDTNENSGDNLTGGYIFGVDKNIWASDSGWKSLKDTGVFFSYKYPKQDDITPQQKKYLQAYVDSFETALQGPNFADLNTGFRKYMDPASFMDFFFMQELSKNLDAFRRSAYMYKDKKSIDGRIHAGPLWDFNSALFNSKNCTFEQDTGWAYQTVCWFTSGFHVPFWWGRLMQDSIYTRDMNCRWKQWRSTVLSTNHIFHILDSITAYIKPASIRHFSRYHIPTTIEPNVDSLKWWLGKRLAWLDANMPGNCWNMGAGDANNLENSFVLYPNPASDVVNISFYLNDTRGLSIELHDALGRKVTEIDENAIQSGSNVLQLDLKNFLAGIYFLKVKSRDSAFTKKLVRTD